MLNLMPKWKHKLPLTSNTPLPRQIQRNLRWLNITLSWSLYNENWIFINIKTYKIRFAPFFSINEAQFFLMIFKLISILNTKFPLKKRSNKDCNNQKGKCHLVHTDIPRRHWFYSRYPRLLLGFWISFSFAMIVNMVLCTTYVVI